MATRTVVLAASPWHKQPGNCPTRVVLRAVLRDEKPIEFVVHYQYHDGKFHYTSGDYFTIRDGDDMNEVFDRAYQRFNKRSEFHMQGATVAQVFDPLALALCNAE